MQRWFSPLVALGALTSCLGGSSTEAASSPTDTGPYAAISTELKDSSSAPAATVLIVRAHVTHAGTAIPGAAVKFIVAAGNGLLSADSTATDTLGVATVQWTLGGAAAQTNTLAILSGDATDTLHVIAVAGSPSYLVPVSATSNDVALGTPVFHSSARDGSAGESCRRCDRVLAGIGRHAVIRVERDRRHRRRASDIHVEPSRELHRDSRSSGVGDARLSNHRALRS